MARELHSLNETEMGMVNEYVEAGIASSHEEALKFLLEINFSSLLAKSI